MSKIASGLDTERRARVAPLNILEDVVVKVDVVVHQLAGDVLPVYTGVIRARNGLVNGLAANGPSCLGDPDGFALGGSNGLVVSVEEKVSTATDTVVERALEVWVCVRC